MSPLVNDAISEMAHIPNGERHLKTSVYDCKYMERLAFAFQSKGGGTISLYVSSDNKDWIQWGRYESNSSLSIENQLAYMPRFCYVEFERRDLEQSMLCIIQKTLYVLPKKEYGMELLCTITP